MNKLPNDGTAQPIAADLLDQVYRALLASDYPSLPGLTEQLERELQNPRSTTSQAGLRLIEAKAHRNEAVLMAAQRGIRSARRRLAEIRATASGLVTYDRSGQRAEVTESRTLAQRF
jgi:hypothetical protein